MHKKLLTKTAIGLVIVLAGFFSGREIAFAYGTIHNGYDTIPAYLECYLDFASDTKTAISSACAEWNNAGSGNLLYKSGTEHSMTQYPIQNNENHITKGERGANSYLAQATNYVDTSTGYSTECDIDINISHPFGTAGSSLVYDVQNAMTHEIGHMLGLDDLYGSSDVDKTMYGYISKGETKKRTLTLDDKNGINSLY